MGTFFSGNPHGFDYGKLGTRKWIGAFGFHDCKRVSEWKKNQLCTCTLFGTGFGGMCRPVSFCVTVGMGTTIYDDFPVSSGWKQSLVVSLYRGISGLCFDGGKK